MKHLVLFVLLFAAARAQWIVNDPVNTAVNSAVQAGQAANHLEILRQWAAQLEQLNRQLRELEAQLAVQQRIRDVMGNPTAAGAGMASTQPARSSRFPSAISTITRATSAACSVEERPSTGAMPSGTSFL